MPPAAPRCIPGAALVLACAWPVSLHGAVLLGAPHWVPRLTAGALIVAAALWAYAARNARAALYALGIALLAAGAALTAPQLLLYAPPVLINAALAIVFAASLRQPREPVITRFARVEHPALPPELALYTRRLTMVWAALFAAMAGVALALALGGSLESWSTFTNVVSYLLVAALFAGEHAYRRRRFRQYRHAGLRELVRNVRGAGLFARR
ncbi:MAG TPA: hypothetical protein VFP62_10740 [Burkholderiales bacterium]|jgi:uncharacterized membrane protein|nr:hypothetical protein [Burkholderiales bacterium]